MRGALYGLPMCPSSHTEMTPSALFSRSPPLVSWKEPTQGKYCKQAKRDGDQADYGVAPETLGNQRKLPRLSLSLNLVPPCTPSLSSSSSSPNLRLSLSTVCSLDALFAPWFNTALQATSAHASAGVQLGRIPSACSCPLLSAQASSQLRGLTENNGSMFVNKERFSAFSYW